MQVPPREYFEAQAMCRGRLAFNQETGCWIWTGPANRVKERCGKRWGRLFSVKFYRWVPDPGVFLAPCPHSFVCVNPKHLTPATPAAVSKIGTTRRLARVTAHGEQLFIEYYLRKQRRFEVPDPSWYTMMAYRGKPRSRATVWSIWSRIYKRLRPERQLQYDIIEAHRRTHPGFDRHRALVLCVQRAWRTRAMTLDQARALLPLRDLGLTTRHYRKPGALNLFVWEIVTGKRPDRRGVPVYCDLGDDDVVGI